MGTIFDSMLHRQREQLVELVKASQRDKSEVDYSPGHPGSFCKQCTHFQPSDRKLGRCELVRGDIDPDYWCKLFDRAKT